jgi:hypothetical protein
VRLSFLDPIETTGADRRALARRAEDAVRASLGHAPRLAPEMPAGGSNQGVLSVQPMLHPAKGPPLTDPA